MNGAAAVQASRAGARRRRGLAAAALAALGLLLQGCAGIAVQWRDTQTLDVVATVAELRERAARDGAPTDGSPRAASYGERVTKKRRRGGLVEWTYRDVDGGCMNLVAIVPVPFPGCRGFDRYTFDGARLVRASRRTYPHYGVVCSPFFMVVPRDPKLCDALWGAQVW